MAKEEKKVKRPTALKRDIQNQKRRLNNRSFKTQVKTTMRVFEDSLKSKENESQSAALSRVYSIMDKGVKRGIFKKNKADRLKSRASNRVLAKDS